MSFLYEHFVIHTIFFNVPNLEDHYRLIEEFSVHGDDRSPNTTSSSTIF